MKVLVVGQGGREHALAWKLARSESVTDVYCAPGNAGIAEDATCVDIAPADISALVSFAKDTPIDLTVVGPEAPLVDGLVDAFNEAGLSAFGPSAAAAALEGSKAYAKEIMHRGNVPTADSTVFEDIADARHFLQEREDQAWVVKADGLAAGKGVLMCATRIEALEAAEGMLVDDDFGPAGARILIEDSLVGEEASILALVDGNTIVSLEASQDHKRAGDGDSGPNTGGMGAYAPVSIVTPELMAEARSKVIQPTLQALAEDGSPFRGLLYAGLIQSKSGLKVIEFNCRFGDPETQAVLPLMQDSLLDLIATVAEGGKLTPGVASARSDIAVATVVASGGYPGSYEKGKEINIPIQLESENCIVFHVGTTRRESRILTSGGRVLAVTALAPSIGQAAKASAEAAGRIEFEGAFYRRDIGWRERSRQDQKKS